VCNKCEKPTQALTISTDISGGHFWELQVPLIQLLSHPIVKQPQTGGQIQVAAINRGLSNASQLSAEITQQWVLGRRHILVKLSLNTTRGQVQQDSGEFDNLMALKLHLWFSRPTGRFKVHNNQIREDWWTLGRRILRNLFAHCVVWRLILHFDSVDEVQGSIEKRSGLLRLKAFLVHVSKTYLANSFRRLVIRPKRRRKNSRNIIQFLYFPFFLKIGDIFGVWGATLEISRFGKQTQPT
jgi:hypothetical protein